MKDTAARLLGETNPIDREGLPEPWVDCLAVVKGSRADGDVEVVFAGQREECYDFMRGHAEGTDWDDLYYAKMRPKFGGEEDEMEVDLGSLASWVL